MALSSQEEELFEHGIGSLPLWMRNDTRANEDLRAAAKIVGTSFTQGEHWQAQARILTAVGPVGDEPDYLAQHARDRGSDRQLDEDDPSVRDRIRNIEDAVTRSALLAAAQAVIDEEGISGDVAMVEMPRDGAFFQTNDAMTSTGGTFTDESSVANPNRVGFESQFGWGAIVYRDPDVEERIDRKLVISGAASAANDGTHVIVGVEDDKLLYDDATAVFEEDLTLTWVLDRYDRDGNKITGFRDSYLDRGDRFTFNRRRRGFIIILPFGSTETTLEKVEEVMRQKKAGGFKFVVERRLNP